VAPGGSELTREEFLKSVAAGLVAATAVAALARPQEAAAEETSRDPLVRMQDDLRRALTKPAEQRRWAMAIDVARCIGCRACTVACRAENKTPPGVTYRPVLVEMEGGFPAPKRRFLPRPCMHCEKPACLEACPAGAIKRRPDGIVYVDYDVCQGIRECITACPYEVPLFDEGGYYTDGTPAIQAYEKARTFEMGVARTRESADQAPAGRARKCHYCLHRLESGMLPACTTTCVGRATFFGDLNDPGSLIAELALSPRASRLREDQGTKPTTFYLM
jgi:molybdopterin-containing oxidoreductase family iron-sulfur binding subunit